VFEGEAALRRRARGGDDRARAEPLAGPDGGARPRPARRGHHGPAAPLGPGAPPLARLLAFLDGIVEVVSRNKGLLATLGHAETATQQRYHANRDEPRPVYQFWHGHISALIAEGRPDLDAELQAHILLGTLHSDPVLRLLEQGEERRLSRSLDALITALLEGPRGA
jgi:AcrR family transcriptional regulator